MNKILISLCVVFGSQSSWAFNLLLHDSERFKVSSSLAARQENLSWTVNGGSINVLSELDWTDIKSTPLSLEFSTRLNNRFNVIGYYQGGNISGGQVRDSDYCLPGHQSEYSRSVLKGEGDVDQYGAAISIPLSKYTNQFSFAGFFGVSRHEQNFKMRTGSQVLYDNNLPCVDGFSIPLIDPPGTPININSSYSAVWQGPWFGFHMNYKNQHLLGALKLNLHVFQSYNGKGVWNQRGFSFRQVGSAFGADLNFFSGFQVNKFFTVGLYGQYNLFDSGGGDEHIRDLNLADGVVFCQNAAEYCTAPGSFNGAEWNAWQLGLTFILSSTY